MSKTISLLSYNVHKCFQTHSQRHIATDIHEALKEADPDLVLLQEVQGQHRKNRFQYQHDPETPDYELLAQDYWPHIIYGKNAIYKDAHHGNAILSKMPLGDWENIDISRMVRASRSILHVSIDGKRKYPLHIICVHLGLFKQERIEQLETLSKRIHEHVPDDCPMIIAGDFNDWLRHATNPMEKELGLKEVFKETTGDYAKTFPAKWPTLRVDRIYYRGLKLIKSNVLKDPPWRELSDHLPVYAEFELC